MFSCEFYKISKNTFFTKHLRATASMQLKFSKLGDQSILIFVKKILLKKQTKNFNILISLKPQH